MQLDSAQILKILSHHGVDQVWDFDFCFPAENTCILGWSHFDPKDFDLVYSAPSEILTPGIFDPQNHDNSFFWS